MIGRRNWLRIAVLLSLLGLALGAFIYFAALRLLQQEQIEIRHWQGLSLSTQGLELEQLSLVQADNQLQLEQLRLGWAGFGLRAPFWQHLQLQRLHLIQGQTQPDTSAPRALPLQPVLQALALLPESLHIQQLQLDLPCAQGRCLVEGDLQLLNRPTADTPLNLDAQLNLHAADQDSLHWQLQLQGKAQDIRLQLQLSVADQPQLQLHSRLIEGQHHNDWQGELNAPELTAAATLQGWLGQWLAADSTPQLQAPGIAQVMAKWDLQLPPGALQLAQLSTVKGQIQLQARLPEAWPLPTLGMLQGELSLSAENATGLWLADSLQADLQLSQLHDQHLQTLPSTLRPETLALRIQPDALFDTLNPALLDRALPLAFELSSTGPGSFTLQGKLALSTAPPWAMQLEDGQLRAKAAAVRLDAVHMQGLDLQGSMRGFFDQQQLKLQLQPGSQLRLGSLRLEDISLEQVSLNTSGLQLQAQYPPGQPLQWQGQGPLDLEIKTLQQPQLKSQGWTLQGQLAADPERQTLQGKLRNDAGLEFTLQGQHSPKSGLRLQAHMAEIFLRGGNPLQQSFSAWPALLSLNNGRLKASADVSMAGNASPLLIKSKIDGKGLAGIYDRTELSGLDLTLQLSRDARQLTLALDTLRLEQANPGVPIGPLTLSARYQAANQRPDKGLLQIDQARSTLLGGQIQLAAGQWNLSDDQWLIPIQVQGVELEQFFILYPTEGLAGSGRLDGELPLLIDATGMSISQGHLGARQPGGQLQFHSERIRALGRSNPAMQLVTQSLEDFRYQVMSTSVDYDQQGTLKLNIRLEGQNPAIERGRPIHFNINLEEDIPSLLASLQLTDKVSEVIKQRVQQRVLQRNANSPSAP